VPIPPAAAARSGERVAARPSVARRPL